MNSFIFVLFFVYNLMAAPISQNKKSKTRLGSCRAGRSSAGFLIYKIMAVKKVFVDRDGYELLIESESDGNGIGDWSGIRITLVCELGESVEFLMHREDIDEFMEEIQRQKEMI